jgi:phage protein D
MPGGDQNPSFVSLRPAVRVEGREHEKINELLLAMRLTEAEAGMSGLELRFLDWASEGGGRADSAFSDEAIVKLGSALTVYAGEGHAPDEIFRGKVTALEYARDERNAPELSLLAEDALQKARLVRRTKVYESATLAGVANEVARAAGLTPRVTGLTDDLGTLVQLDESDLAFLRRLLARHGADLQVVGEELHVSPRQDVRRGALTLAHGAELREVRIAADLADQVSEVTATGWDAAQGARVTGRSDGSGLGPGRGRTGASVLEDKFGRRAEHLGRLAAMSTEAEARAVASAEHARRARRFVRVTGKAVGSPSLRVGTHVSLTGLPDRWNNTYYVVRAEHRFDLASGYETLFEAEGAYLGDAR